MLRFKHMFGASVESTLIRCYLSLTRLSQPHRFMTPQAQPCKLMG